MSRDFRDLGTPTVSTMGFYTTGFLIFSCRTSQLRALPLVFRDVEVCGSEESSQAKALGEGGEVRVNDWGVLKLKIRTPAA